MQEKDLNTIVGAPSGAPKFIPSRYMWLSVYTFSLEDATYTLRLQDLLFIEAFGHSVVIHSSSDEYRTRGSLKDLNAQLPQGCFAMPHKSYIVNLNAVKSATSTELCLINDAKIPISRRKLHDFQKRFYHFLGR